MKTFKFRFITLLLVCTFSVITAFAQDYVSHKIAKGETLYSIAEKYGVTVDDIKKANPKVGNYFYAGLTIQIPNKGTTNVQHENKTSLLNHETKSSNLNFNQQTGQSNEKIISSTTDPFDFSFWGFEYVAPFEETDKGGYYFNWQVFYRSGWGVEFGIGANYGLIDSDFAGTLYRLGIIYGYALSEKILLSTSFGFDGSYHGTGTYIESGYSNSSANWGGHYYEVERKGDLKFDWGLSLKPQLIFKTGKIMPHVGLSFNWSKETKEIETGFVVGIGF